MMGLPWDDFLGQVVYVAARRREEYGLVEGEKEATQQGGERTSWRRALEDA